MAPKKATQKSNTSQLGSSKQEQPQPWREEAEARLRRNRQFSVKDITVFTIDISATKEEFEEFMNARVNHMRRVAATFVQGSPVTPPNVKGFVTYHAVKLTDREGGLPPAVLLFQEYNLYFTAFQPETEDAGPLDAGEIETKDSDTLRPTGWFAFRDAEMPDFLAFVRINYNVSYKKSAQEIRLGFGVTGDILHKLLGFNTVNRLDKSAERELALHITPYMMSELLRLGKALEEVTELIRRKKRDPLTNPLVNCWGNISRVAFSYEFSQNEGVLKKAASDYKLNLFSEGSTEDYSISKLVGVDGYLRVLLYSEPEIEALLKKRQKDNPASTVLALKILVGQGKKIHMSEVERELFEECCKHGRVLDFHVDDTGKILVQYSHPRAAYEAKIYLDGSLVGEHIVEALFSNERSFSLLQERCKGKKVKVQPQSGSHVELSTNQTPPTDFTGVAANNGILQTECNNQIAAVEEDIFQGSSSNSESSDKQISVCDHLKNPSVANVKSGNQSVVQLSEEPGLVEELHFLACAVRSVPSAPSEPISISSSLLRRLGKIISPPQLEYYTSQLEKLAVLLASHEELFVVTGDMVHLCQGAQQRISGQIAAAKVKAAQWSKSATSDLPIIAVTPRAPSTQGKAFVGGKQGFENDGTAPAAVRKKLAGSPTLHTMQD